MPYVITQATKKIDALTKRIRGVQGGTSAGKTVGITEVLIDRCQHEDTEGDITSIVSESFPHLKRGVVRDFLGIMESQKYFKPKRWNKTDYTYEFETGAKLEFFSADQPSKVRGPRRKRLFINEANNVPFETFEQLEVRTAKEIFLDWNPVTEFWYHTEIEGQRDDTEMIILTYKDNEALPEAIVESIEQRKHRKNWWTVYGEGLLGEAEGRIYTGWKVVDEVPHEARLERYGLDFGYSNDPTAIVGIYYYNGGYILDEVLYRTGMKNRQIADVFESITDALVVADSAEPKSIDEIKERGINIVPAQKGQGSVNEGIDKVQDQKISVTKRSLNLLKEYRGYLWEVDKDGKTLNKPQDFNNHCFVGGTIVMTEDGGKPIREVKLGNKVLTSKGYKEVLLTHDNGIKPVNKYRLQLDTDVVELECTSNHKIKTTKGWQEISKLKPGAEVYLNSISRGKGIRSTRERGTSQGLIGECIEMCGRSIMGQYQKVSTFITLMRTHGITGLKTLSLLMPTNTCHSIYGKDLSITRNGQGTSRRRELKLQRSGMLQKKGLNGIGSMRKGRGRIESTKHLLAKCVGKNIKQDTQEYLSTATKTARLKHLDAGEEKKKRVYDLTVAGVHEYYANGILVHNCMDALRYGLSSKLLSKTSMENIFSQIEQPKVFDQYGNPL